MSEDINVCTMCQYGPCKLSNLARTRPCVTKNAKGEEILNLPDGCKLVKINSFKSILFDVNDRFSWRKVLTLMAGVLFSYAVIGFLIKNDYKEMPASYILVISLIIAFYFGKEAINRIGNKTVIPTDPQAQ